MFGMLTVGRPLDTMIVTCWPPRTRVPAAGVVPMTRFAGTVSL